MTPSSDLSATQPSTKRYPAKRSSSFSRSSRGSLSSGSLACDSEHPSVGVWNDVKRYYISLFFTLHSIDVPLLSNLAIVQEYSTILTHMSIKEIEKERSILIKSSKKVSKSIKLQKVLCFLQQLKGPPITKEDIQKPSRNICLEVTKFIQWHRDLQQHNRAVAWLCIWHHMRYQWEPTLKWHVRSKYWCGIKKTKDLTLASYPPPIPAFQLWYLRQTLRGYEISWCTANQVQY